MPNRILKETVCESKKLSEVSFFAEDLYKRLITYADDYGRFNADYQIILARLYPRELGIVSIDDIEDAMTELVGAEKIAFYTSEAKHELYGCFPRWSEHQRVRDSKKKYPDPDDTSVNDWYLRRYIPMEMKRIILDRDKFKCQECGKYLFAGVGSTDRVIKFGAGMFHIDHIVPVNQGGRATEENLRLLCSSCNLKRKKRFTISEIIDFSRENFSSDSSQKFAATCGESRQLAATCGELPQIAASRGESRPESNPIQSESISESVSESESNAHARVPALFDIFWSVYPKHEAKQAAQKAFDKLKPDEALVQTMVQAIEKWKQTDQWQENGGQFIPYPATWLNGRRWEDDVPEKRKPKPAVKPVVAQQYEQRDYSAPKNESFDDLYDRLDSLMGNNEEVQE